MARGTRMWRPPLVDRSVTASPPASVIQVSARVKSSSTVAWRWRLVSKSRARSLGAAVQVERDGGGVRGAVGWSRCAVRSNLPVARFQVRMVGRAAMRGASAFQVAAGPACGGERVAVVGTV